MNTVIKSKIYEKERNQRTVTFAALCNLNPERAFKTRSEHEDVFYAGMYTPDGVFSIECDVKFWGIFKCRAINTDESPYACKNNGDVCSLLLLPDKDFKKFIFEGIPKEWHDSFVYKKRRDKKEND